MRRRGTGAFTAPQGASTKLEDAVAALAVLATARRRTSALSRRSIRRAPLEEIIARRCADAETVEAGDTRVSILQAAATCRSRRSSLQRLRGFLRRAPAPEEITEYMTEQGEGETLVFIQAAKCAMSPPDMFCSTPSGLASHVAAVCQ